MQHSSPDNMHSKPHPGNHAMAIMSGNNTVRPPRRHMDFIARAPRGSAAPTDYVQGLSGLASYQQSPLGASVASHGDGPRGKTRNRTPSSMERSREPLGGGAVTLRSSGVSWMATGDVRAEFGHVRFNTVRCRRAIRALAATCPRVGACGRAMVDLGVP